MSREKKGEPIWGPEIPVNGKRPEWLGPGEKGLFQNTPGEWLDGFDWAWGEAEGCPISIRLPADHPHYQQAGPTACTSCGNAADLREPGDQFRCRCGRTVSTYLGTFAMADPLDVDTVTIKRMTQGEAEARGELCGFGSMGRSGYVQALRDFGLIVSDLDRFMAAHPTADRATAEKALEWGREV